MVAGEEVAGEEYDSALLANCEEICRGTGRKKSMEFVEELGHWFRIEDRDSGRLTSCTG